jgi:hypothetical protein
LKNSELTRNGVAIALGLLISGAIVFGQRSGGVGPNAAYADESSTPEGLTWSGLRTGRTAGPQAAPTKCQSVNHCSPADPDGEGDPVSLDPPRLMQTQ